MAILIVLLGIVTIARMSTDIFPRINIPVVSVIWSFPGEAPEEMANRFVTVTERAMTTTVNDIEHIESQSYNGVAVIRSSTKGAKVGGVAQVSICETLLRILPPGTTPPSSFNTVHRCSDSSTRLTSATLSEHSFDLGLNFIRTQLDGAGRAGAAALRRQVRQVMVDIDLRSSTPRACPRTSRRAHGAEPHPASRNAEIGDAGCALNAPNDAGRSTTCR
jgi:hypothetical protein